MSDVQAYKNILRMAPHSARKGSTDDPNYHDESCHIEIRNSILALHYDWVAEVIESRYA